VNDDLDCNEFVELVTDYLEGALDDAETVRVVAHLRLCDGCDRYLAQFRDTIAMLGGQRSPGSAYEARQQLLAAFRSMSPP
jgi:anti-sigma factor RsiW